MSSNKKKEKEWPRIDFNSYKPDETDEINKILKIYLETTKDANKQSIEGTRAVYTKSASVLTQSSTFSLSAIGALFFIIQGTDKNSPSTFLLFIIPFLIISFAMWTASAICAAAGLWAQTLGATSPTEDDFKNPAMFTSSLAEAQYYLLRVNFESISKSRKGAKKAKWCQNLAVVLLASAPLCALAISVILYFSSLAIYHYFPCPR